MKISELDNDLITKYLTGTLNASDEALLKSKLNNEDFRAELETQAELLDALEVAEEDLIRDELLKADSTGTATTTSSSARPPAKQGKLLYILLGGLLALSIFGVLKHFLEKAPASDPIQMAEMYATPYPPRDVYRSVVEDKESDVQVKDAMKAYTKKQYDEALELFKKVSPQTEEIEMYTVNCLIAKKEYAAAKVLIPNLLKSPYQDLAQNAEWYLAICELGLKNVSVAKQHLQTIKANPSHSFRDRAIKLLGELK